MTNKSNASNILNNIPLIFEKNVGQYDKQVKFVLKQNGCTTFFTQSEVVLALATLLGEKNSSEEYEINSLRINLENSNQSSEIIGEEKFNCNINYFKGSSKSDWKTDVPIYQKIVYKEIYPGIDLVYYGNNGRLEHDFIVSPEADISNIKMNFDGSDKIEIDEEDNLVINLKENTVKMIKPIVYQEIEKEQVEIMSNFVIEDEKKASFNISVYDKNKTLIIDPQLVYSSYLGGNGTDNGYAIAVDSDENAYITGSTNSTSGFPITSSAYQSTLKGFTDTFLIKIDTKANGVASLLYGSYLGGIGNDYGYGVAVDENQNAYITGYTNSTSGFPITPNAYQSTFRGSQDAFLIKINTIASGASSLAYGSYLGGTGYDYGIGVAVDSNEIAYITGSTNSSIGFPITPNAYQSTLRGSQDAFLIKIDTIALSGPASLVYGTYLGGTGYDYGRGIAVDSNKNAYITGWTTSISGFPITSYAYQSTLKGSQDAFLIKFDTINNLLKYGTYLGGNGINGGYGLAIDDSQNAYITGYTTSISGFPITSYAYQSTLKGSQDAFLIKINTIASSGGASLVYGTYLGGSGTDVGYGVDVDASQNAYITGWTTSTSSFPITSYAYQSTLKGSQDAFLIKISTIASSGGASLVYGTYLGGSGVEYGFGVAVDNNQKIYIAGQTTSPLTGTTGTTGITGPTGPDAPFNRIGDTTGPTAPIGFPTTPNAYQSTLKGSQDVFLTKLYPQICDLKIEKSTCKCTPCVGEKIPYTIKLKNNGPGIAYNIVVTDIIPSGVYVTSMSASVGSICKSSGNVIWNIPQLKVGDSVIAMIVVIATNKVCFSNDGNIINKCEISSFEGIALKNMSDTVITHIDCCCNCKK